MDLCTLGLVGGVVVPEPVHHAFGQEVALGKLLVRAGIEPCVGHRPHQQLEAQRRGFLFLGHQRDDGCHVAADAVAGHGEALAIDADVLAMFSHPTGRGVGLVDRGRVVRFRRRRVIDIHRNGAGADHQVVDQTLVSRVIAQHPTATVEEHEHRQITFDLGRPYDFQVDGLTIDLDRTIADVHTRQINLHRVLRTGEHRTGVFRTQLLERLATTGSEGFEEGLGVVFDAGAASGKSVADGEGEEGRGQGFFDEVHEEILFN
ncbi:hypothetical protein EMIT0P100_10784 [Pseudomonas sp. IT-P100]